MARFKILAWTLLAILCLAVGFYPAAYFLNPGKFGLLQSKSDAVLGNPLWRAGFYTHITFGGVALAVGWAQFIGPWRKQFPTLHRFVGKLYGIAVAFSSLAAIGIAPVSSTGWIAAVGFGGLGVVWFVTTLKAYNSIRRGDVPAHGRWAIHSFAACLAAVTLRFWLPLMMGVLSLGFDVAYPIVAWLCWVPNLIVACWITSGFPFRGQASGGS
jgi:hypothetical protein